MSNPFWTHWYYHLPNYAMAVVIYTLIARFLLGFFVPPGWNNYIWRGFRYATEWSVRLVSVITPQIVPFHLLLAITAFWFYMLRIAFTLFMAGAGLTPPVAVQ